jgi:NADH:ubiquinone oxidoreductase subunit H
MKGMELAIGIMLTLGGIRSLWRWSRQHMDSSAPADHLLFAMYVTGRVGLWFAFAALFIGYASIDQVDRFRWFILLPISLSSMQLIGGVLLGRASADRSSDRSSHRSADG